jgi:hypothetical protein
MLGSRSIWHDGWTAVTTHPTISGWSNFGRDTWELYNSDVDRSELHDLASEEPKRLQEMINLWYAEAGANGAFPLDGRGALEIILTPRPLLTPPRDRYVYYPGLADVRSPRRPTCATAPTPSQPWSTSPRRAPTACCSRTVRASAATLSTSGTTGCTTSTTTSASSSRRSSLTKTCRPEKT